MVGAGLGPFALVRWLSGAESRAKTARDSAPLSVMTCGNGPEGGPHRYAVACVPITVGVEVPITVGVEVVVEVAIRVACGAEK